MIYATGTYNKTTGTYTMHAPKFPYDTTTYVGYTEKEMKKKYRATFGLERKHIEWIIL